MWLIELYILIFWSVNLLEKVKNILTELSESEGEGEEVTNNTSGGKFILNTKILRA